MSDYFKDLEYYSSIHNSYVYGEIIDIREDDGYLMKNKKDGTEETCKSKHIRKVTNVSPNSLEKGTWEYIKSEDEYIEVKIKEQKGLFYILELIDEEGNSSTMLSRKKNLRCINYIPLDDYLEDKYENIILDIPPELTSWINSEKFEELIQQIKDETSKDSENSSEIFIDSYPSEEPSSLRILCDSEQSDFVKLLLTEAMNNEKKLCNVNKDKENSKKELEDVKKKNKTFTIPQKFVGLIIGKEGANINNLKSKYGVNITIDSKNIKDKKFAKVIVTGDNGDNVEECSKEIDIIQKIFEISENCATDIKKRVNNLMETFKIKIYISYEEKKDDDKVYKAPNIECIGNEEYINDFYEKEIKYYDNYEYGNDYKNNNYSSGYYRQNNKRYNNYNGYHNNYKSYKNYNSYNNYY